MYLTIKDLQGVLAFISLVECSDRLLTLRVSGIRKIMISHMCSLNLLNKEDFHQ